MSSKDGMKKVVFITGISSGFGKSMSALLASGNYIVYGTCRKACETHPSVHVLQMDVTSREQVEKCIAEVIRKEGRIDVLINNAGMHTGGPIEIIDGDLIKQQIDTNINGIIYTIRAVLPHMRNNKSGTIVNIGSIGGLMGLPFQGYYSVCKFALEGLSQSLRMEVRPFNIKVIVINPGDFHTRNTANRKYPSHNGDYEEQFRKTLQLIEKDENGGQHPDILAKKMERILAKKNPRHHYVIASFSQQLAVVIHRLIPEKWFDAILRAHYGIR
jgi:NAD(P)-dependent dehydrogenase (short-subunit alcohol dehydrogenase family)